jgi:Tfp pilus assembly protein FimT
MKTNVTVRPFRAKAAERSFSSSSSSSLFWKLSISFKQPIRGGGRGGEGRSRNARFFQASETRRSNHFFVSAFTLIEIMVVVCIMAIIMGMTVPFAYKALRKEGMSQAVSEVVEVCSHARARAIMGGQPTFVVFDPKTKTFHVEGGAAGTNTTTSAPEESIRPDVQATLPANSGLSGQLDEHVDIQMLDVNLTEYKDREVARVRFNPNGTSDEFTLILQSDKNECRKISLEVTTGLASVESDPNKWR